MKLVHLVDIFSGAWQSLDSTVSKSLKRVFSRSPKAAEKPHNDRSPLKPGQKRLAIGTAVVVGAITAYATLSRLFTLFERHRRWSLIQQCEAHETELFLFILPRSPWAPSLSPDCTRVETFLRANRIPYKAIEVFDPLGAPNGELPFLIYKRQRVDQLPKMVEFIASEFHVTMDNGLTRDQRAVGASLRRTLEYNVERLLYRIVFVDHPSLAIPQIARALHISHVHARFAVHDYAIKLKKRLAITAYGALVSEHFENEFMQDCESIEAQIGSKRYLFSDTIMTSYDCAVYALLVPFAYMGRHTPLSAAYSTVADSEVLMAYITRISKQLFSDVFSCLDVARMSLATSCIGGTDEKTALEAGEERK
ncbi:hypothetical protein, conserved [Leishmania tarentolae]|uniref:Thioredoxin-like fold domain-containing protein n=1 Tax=Leishmania tarentolae TaxID=5689 RepID=A0A640KH22_LEITA|nr:hypothetical protein, conserved [Leishmania tarentolae]